jgi:hypothetical protein
MLRSYPEVAVKSGLSLTSVYEPYLPGHRAMAILGDRRKSKRGPSIKEHGKRPD